MMKHVWIGFAFFLAFLVMGYFFFEVGQRREYLQWVKIQDIEFKKWLVTRQGGRGPIPSHVDPAL